MTYTEHININPERIAATAAAAIDDSVVLPALFRREDLGVYAGADDDTVNIKVEGVLPYRTYGWRNDRSTSLQFDAYTERKYPVTFAGDLYSGVKITDEQRTMDALGWDKLAVKQTDALVRGLEDECVETMLNAPYEVKVTLDEADMRGSLVRLKKVYDRLRVQGQRRLVMGSDIEAAILLDDKIALSQNSSEAVADTALREAFIGRVAGFNLMSVNEVPTDEAVAMVDSAFVLVTGAPSVPMSVKHGATASVGLSSVRWITSFDSEKNVDRSIFTLYKGSRHIADPLMGKDASTGQAFVSEENHFVRAIKVELGSAFGVEVDNAELDAITNLGGYTAP